MRARISPTTAKMTLTDAQRLACAQHVEALWKQKQSTITRRFFAAMCLALNDLYHFGDKRLMFVMTAVADILEDYASQSFTPRENRKGSINDGERDACFENMMAELSSRKKIHIEIGDFMK